MKGIRKNSVRVLGWSEEAIFVRYLSPRLRPVREVEEEAEEERRGQHDWRSIRIVKRDARKSGVMVYFLAYGRGKIVFLNSITSENCVGIKVRLCSTNFNTKPIESSSETSGADKYLYIFQLLSSILVFIAGIFFKYSSDCFIRHGSIHLI